MIEVKRSAGDEWVVSIKGTVTTHHRVRVTKADVERLAGGQSSKMERPTLQVANEIWVPFRRAYLA